ncbi:MAG: ABC transporter permease [Solirubrobacteraceae bacterium]
MSTMEGAIDAIRAAGGSRITGPRALTGDPRRALHLTWTLAYLEFRLRFFGSVLGYLWQLARPLAMFGVYYVVFVPILHLGGKVPYYGPTLLAGIMLYQFFAECTGGSVGAVLARENLVRKIHFPRIVIPLSVIVSSALTLMVNTVAVGVFMAIQRVPIRLNWLAAVPAVALLFVFVTGLAMLLSSLFVRYRDVQPIWDVVLQAAFYATPILYSIEQVPHWAERIIMCNPLSVIVQQIRHSVFDQQAPSAADAIGGPLWLLIPVGFTFALFALGFWVFNRTAPAVAEEL